MKEEAGDQKTQQDNPVYSAMIESVDNNIGKILESLKQTGQYDNTIIVLVSDHGGLSNRGNKRPLATTNLPLRAGKGHLYEGGIKVPFMIHLPGQSKNYMSDVPVVTLDLLPTFADICDLRIETSRELDGVSLRPLLDKDKKTTLAKRDLFWHKAQERPIQTGDYVSTAIRSGKYKLIDFYDQKRIELYDLSKDPEERNNLASEKPAIVKELMGKIVEWRHDFKVPMASKKTKVFKDKNYK